MELFEIYGAQKTLTQWDLGRRMQVNGQCQQLHFANEGASEAMVCPVQEVAGVRTARIPDEVLQKSGILWVYGFVEAEEGYTKRIRSFFVKERPQPAGYVYTPTQWVKLEDVMARMDALEQKAEEDPTVPAWAKEAKKPAYTAAEVGARPATWMPTAAQVGARPATWMPTAAQVGARPSDWMPTAAEVGAAPAGYGLGTSVATAPTNDSGSADANLITKTGFYRALVNKPFTGWCYILHMQYGSGVAKQFCFDVDINCSAMRNYYDSTWEAWEYINPPMTVGVEYLTTERWNGKPVYTKAMDMGALPNATLKKVSHEITSLEAIVEVRIFAVNGAGDVLTVPLTSGSDTTLSVAHGIDKVGVWVNTRTDRSAYNGYAWLKYVKVSN